MKETTRRSDKMPKRYSSSFDAGGRYIRTPGIRRLVLAGVLAALLTPAISAQQDVAGRAVGAEVPAPVLSRDTQLSEAEAALGELSRRVGAVADAVEEQGPPAHRAVLEDLRSELQRWSDMISAMSVEPAEDADIDRRRFRRFERRMRSSTADVNAAVERINESLKAASEIEAPSNG